MSVLSHPHPVTSRDMPTPSVRRQSEWTSSFLSFAIGVYFVLFVTEGFTRWILNMAGLDALIFLRDALVFAAVAALIAEQIVQRRIDPFVIVFAVLVVAHATLAAANLRDIAPPLAGIKPYISLLIGAFAARHLFIFNRRLGTLLVILWLTCLISACLDKYFVEWPWMGLTTEIAGTKVEISRDWQITGADKRAGGLARSSIHLAGFMSIAGLLLYYRAKTLSMRVLIAAGTVLTVFWSTQKGALMGLVFVFLIAFVPRRLSIVSLKIGLIVAVTAMIALPIILPQYEMPVDSAGVFSLQSFYDRASRMWPDAWDWYNQRSSPLFGVGIGGIGFAMRLYSEDAAFYAADLASYEPYLINFADNMFVYLFVQFGYLSLVYIGFVLFGALRISTSYDTARATALAVLVFCVGYGIAVSIIEDQIACMFLGASAYYLWHDYRRSAEQGAAMSPTGGHDPYRVPFRATRRSRPGLPQSPR